MDKIKNILKLITRNKKLLTFTVITFAVLIFGAVVLIKSLLIPQFDMNRGLKNATKEQYVDGFKFSETKIEFIEGKTSFITTITNKTDTNKELEIIDIYVYDVEDNLLIKFGGHVGRTLYKNENREITCLIDKELKDAWKVEYKIPE